MIHHTIISIAEAIMSSVANDNKETYLNPLNVQDKIHHTFSTDSELNLVDNIPDFIVNDTNNTVLHEMCEDCDACCVCCENIVENDDNNNFKTICNHVFHKECLFKWTDNFSSMNDISCPMCRSKLVNDENKCLFENRHNTKYNHLHNNYVNLNYENLNAEQIIANGGRGSLSHLIASGHLDSYLVGRPRIRSFTTRYRPNTNFAMNVIDTDNNANHRS
jgi:hypothetical protein